MNPDSESAFDAALEYLQRGWSVVPIRARDKRPIIAWQDLQVRRPGREEIQRWFARWPEGNVAIVTGRISELVVLDVDRGHGGMESIRALEQAQGRLPDTVEAVSGGGGQHLYFVHPGGHIHNRVAVFPGIDLRGDGGLIVAPPSVHPNGQRYRWVPGRSPAEVSLARLPSWLLRRLAPAAGTGHPVSYWRDLLAQGVGEGQRNSTVASISGHLLWHGVDVQVVIELLLCWNRARCQPALSDAEVVSTVESISRLHHRQHKG